MWHLFSGQLFPVLSFTFSIPALNRLVQEERETLQYLLTVDELVVREKISSAGSWLVAV